MSNESKIASAGTFLFLSTLLVNAGNYAINLVLGRWLGPAEFSEVSILVTFVLMVSFFALGFQLTAAKFIAESYHHNLYEAYHPLKKWLNKKALILGFVLMAMMIFGAIFLKSFFNTTSFWPFVIVGLGMPFYLIFSVNRGFLQGMLSYKKLAITYQIEMLVRLVVTFMLVYLGFKVIGVAFGLTLSLIFTWLYSRLNYKSGKETAIDEKATMNFLLIILLYECSQILINNSDILIVKHFYTAKNAGLYAALALIGRIVYFGTWTVVTILFPMVIKLEKEGKNHLKLFVMGLLAVALMASAIILVCYLFPEFVIGTLFGKNYLSMAPFLWKYATATALFACANVFVYYHLSLNRRLPIAFTIFAGILQIITLWFFHKNIEQVIDLQICIMLSLLVTMLTYQVLYKRFKVQSVPID